MAFVDRYPVFLAVLGPYASYPQYGPVRLIRGIEELGFSFPRSFSESGMLVDKVWIESLFPKGRPSSSTCVCGFKSGKPHAESQGTKLGEHGSEIHTSASPQDRMGIMRLACDKQLLKRDIQQDANQYSERSKGDRTWRL